MVPLMITLWTPAPRLWVWSVVVALVIFTFIAISSVIVPALFWPTVRAVAAVRVMPLPDSTKPPLVVLGKPIDAALVTRSLTDDVFVVPENTSVAPVALGSVDQLPLVLQRLSAPAPVHVC